MWRRSVAAFLLSIAIASAGESSGGIWDFLPEVVATVDGKPIRRSELSVNLPAGAVPDRAALVSLMRGAVEAKICLSLIDELLHSAGIVPSRELALEYLKQLNSLLPRGIPGTPPERFSILASQPQFQLNAALHRCFARMAPDQIKVTDQEIETFYRLNQPQFLLPEQVDLGIIQFPASRPTAREEAETVRSRLLQGEAFDRVAREVNPEGVTLDAGAIVQLLRREQPELKVNGISRPLRAGEFWVVVKLRGKTEPAFVPLETVAPYIREQLAAAKVGRALELYLRERMQKMKIEFHLEPVAPGSPATGGPSAGSR